jgi:hypothetical protein
VRVCGRMKRFPWGVGIVVGKNTWGKGGGGFVGELLLLRRVAACQPAFASEPRGEDITDPPCQRYNATQTPKRTIF